MQKIEIYPDSHPYVVIMKSGVTFHLRSHQYEPVAQAWASREVVMIGDYTDPITGKQRPLNFDGPSIEIVDIAQEAQKQHWQRQGGFICKFNTFHERRDRCECRPAPDYSAQRDSGLMTRTFDDTSREFGEENVNRMKAAMVKRNKELEKVYTDIEIHLRQRGIAWCETNRSKWEITTANGSAKMNMWGLFQHNHRNRFTSAVADFEKAQKEREVTEEVVDEIPF